MIFLSRGQTVYSSSPTQLPSFFAEFCHSLPESDNRTEFALDLICDLEGSPGGTKSLVEFNKSWQSMTKQRQTERGKIEIFCGRWVSLELLQAMFAAYQAHDPAPFSWLRFGTRNSSFNGGCWLEI